MCFNRIQARTSKAIFTLVFLLVSTALCYGNDLITTLEGHADIVLSVAYSPDGKTLASGAEDGTIKLWDVATGQNVAVLEGHISSIINDVSSIAYSPDGKTLASGSWDNTIKLWDIATGSNVATLQGHTGWITSVAYSPDGKILVSGSEDHAIKLWDVETERIRILATLKDHTSSVTSVAYSPDGKTLVSGSEDGEILVWDLAKRKNIATPEGHKDAVLSIAYSPDGKTLASSSRDRTIKLWDLATGSNITTLYGNTFDEFAAIAYSPDGEILASGAGFIFQGQYKGKGTIKLWDVWTGQNIDTLEGGEHHHTGRVTSIAYSPDGKTLASGASDNTIKLWNVSNK